MASLNKVMIIGNLTRDPEVRYTPKGSAVVDLGIAVNRFYTTDTGEKREETTFVDVTLWGRQAEVAGQYLAKGRSVFIEGRLQLDTWDDRETGQKRSKLRVIGEGMQFLGGRDGGEGGGGGNGGGSGGYGGNRAERPAGSPPPQQQRRPQGASGPPPAQNRPVMQEPDYTQAEDDDIPF